MLKRPQGRASPALPLFEARRHKGSACGWCLSLGLRLALVGSLVLLICGFVGLVLWQGTSGGGADGEDGDDGGAVEVSLVRSVQRSREEEKAQQHQEERLVVPPAEVTPADKNAASERGGGAKKADDWFQKWAARQESADEDGEPQLTTTGTRKTDEEVKRPNSKGEGGAKKSADAALPRSPCPYFASVNATSVVVRWQHPPSAPQSRGAKALWCELKVKPTHGTARTQLVLRTHACSGDECALLIALYKVYEGVDTHTEVRDLKPVTEYRFSLLCRRSEESREKTMRACGRRLTTRGAHNLVANPSFEDRGPQHYVKYFDQNYMKIDPNSFPAYWHSMMTPIELCTDRALTGASSMCFKSPDKANYKYGASQFVFINTTTAETAGQGGDEDGHEEEEEEVGLGGPTKRYLLLSAWSAAKDVSGKRDGGYGIGLQLKFADGSHSYGHKMTWRTEDHRWEKECMVIEIEQDVMSVNIFILFLDHSGTVWFDDLFLAATTTIEPGFEGCRVERADTPVRHGCCPNRYTVRSALSPDPKGVAIATQLTIDRLPSLRMMAQNWDGPISAAVFVMDEAEVDEVLYFRSTWDKLTDNVDFHLVISERNYAYRTLGLYPVNTLRNIALARCRTEHALILDADFIPSPDSYSVIMDMMPRLGSISESAHETAPDSPGVVWVVPAFEIEPGVTIAPVPLPDSRKELVEMSRQDLIRQVHEVKWAPAHAPTNYTAWMNSSEPYEITFRPEYEPYMMVPRDSVPLYDERFIGYGYDKVAQATELNIAGYRFFGLPEVFVIHYDHGVPKWRGKGDVNFYSFLGEVDLAYKTWPPRRHSRQPERVAEYDADTDADVIKAAFQKKAPPAASS